MKKRSQAPYSTESREPPSAEHLAVIESMNASGQGIARVGGIKRHLPFTLPGETVIVHEAGAGETIAITASSKARVQPVCPHFGFCGGCALQHWGREPYEDWKKEIVGGAMRRAGLAAEAIGFRRYPDASRRRAAFSVRMIQGRVEIGYARWRSHDAFDLAECPILRPELVRVLPPLREALRAVLPPAGEARLHLTLAANGIDCAIEGPDLDGRACERLPSRLAATGILRALWNAETVFLAAPPYVVFGGIRCPLPPAAFLQAVEACERDMAAFAVAALQEANVKGRVCDLFAGLGAFTFPVAKLFSVSAFEADAAAVASLKAAARTATGVKTVAATRRDLYRNPLGAAELRAFSAALLDPPREGAQAQCRALAASTLETIVMMSCNPATFARDAAILAAGGFQIARLTAFDQFKYSPHVELAALLRRPQKKRAGSLPPRRASF
jgi:23S rRNA (uracil1939-C5)-methyltransferase